jgi:transposase InsO family protein
VVQYHASARLTARGRLALLQGAEQNGSVTASCRRFGVSRRTYYRWRARYRAHGNAGLLDRSSRPHHSPRRLAVEHERAIAELRRQRGWGPDRIAAVLGLSRATVHRTIRRLGLQRRPPPREPALRYERERAGELVHVDTKKLGSLRRGIGHRLDHNREWRPAKMTPAGYVVLYAAIDDATRLAYTEYLRDERSETAAGFLNRAIGFFASHGIVTQRVLTDNGSPFVSHLWAAACTAHGVHRRHTRPYRPQTNGKVERFFRTALEECLYVQSFASDTERAAALQQFVCYYNTERPHLALRGLTPLQRLALEPPGVTNLLKGHT